MKPVLRLIFSISFIAITGNVAVGQESTDSLNVSTGSILERRTSTDTNQAISTEEIVVASPDAKSPKRDTINYPLVSAVGIYFDYPKLFSFFTEFENKAEIGLEAQIFKHFILRSELGRSRIKPKNFYKNANYEVSGNYVRIGAAFTKALGGTSRMIIGFNYGSSYFDDKGNIQIESPSGLFNPFEEEFRRKGLTGDWFEITFGTESHLGKNLYLGFTARLRKLNRYDSFEELEVFSVPGYGRTFDKSIPALNLYMKYRVQFY